MSDNSTNTQINESKNVSTETITPSTSDSSIQWEIPRNDIQNKVSTTSDVAVGPDVGTRMTRDRKRPYISKLIFDSAEELEKKKKPNINSILNIPEPEETVWEVPPSENE